MADNMIYSGVSSSPINPVMDRVYTNPMEKISEGAEEIHVRAYVAYGKTADHKLYLESTFKTQIDQADVKYAFERGMLIVNDGTNMLVPVFMTGNKVVTVSAATGSATATEWTAKAGA